VGDHDTLQCRSLKHSDFPNALYNYIWRRIPSDLNLQERHCESLISRANQHLFYYYDDQSVECSMRDTQIRHFSRKTEGWRQANRTLKDVKFIENVS